MGRTVPTLVAVLACLIVAFVVLGAVLRQGVPFPLIFSGMVSVQEAAAPEGLALLACVRDCNSYQSDAVTTGPGAEYIGLLVGPPDETFVNDMITFWIVTDFGRIQATQTVRYRIPADPAGLTPTLDLEFTEPVPLPPPPTPTPTPTITPTPTATPILLLPITGDPSASQLPRVALIAGIAALAAGGAILYLVRRRRAF